MTEVFLVLVGVALASAAIGAALHRYPTATLGPALLWPGIGVLIVAGVVSLFSMGPWLLTAALLAVIAALAANRHRRGVS